MSKASAFHSRELFRDILPKLVLAVFFLANPAFAELRELDDKALEELRGKEGITIDLAFKLEIGEIAWEFHDDKQLSAQRQKALTPPPPRIEYHQNGN